MPSLTQPDLASEPEEPATLWEGPQGPATWGQQEPGPSWAADSHPGAGTRGWLSALAWPVCPAHLILQLVHTICLLWASLHELRWVIILMADGGAAQEKGAGVRLAVCSSYALAPAPRLASPNLLSMEPCSGCTLRGPCF